MAEDNDIHAQHNVFPGVRGGDDKTNIEITPVPCM